MKASNPSHPRIFKPLKKRHDEVPEGPEALRVNLRSLEAPGKVLRL